MRNIVFIWNECERTGTRFLEAQQECTSLRYRKAIGWGLGKHPYKTEFGN